MTPSPSGGGFAPFRVPAYRLLFGGLLAGQAIQPLQFITQIFWIQEVAPPELRILLVGLIGATRGVGSLSLGLLGGALADRLDRRDLLRAVQALQVAVVLSMAGLLAWSGAGAGAPAPVAVLVVFFALVYAGAALLAMDIPTRLALVPDVVGARLTPAGISLNTAGGQLAMPLAILVSGVLIEGLGFGATYALSALGPALDLLLLQRMGRHLPRARAATPGSLADTLRAVRGGVAYARRHRTVLWILVLMIAMTALGMPAVTNLGPTWITTVVQVPYRWFGAVGMVWGLGAFAASLALTYHSLYERKGRLLVAAALCFALSFGVFSAGHTVPYAVFGNLGLGISLATSQITATSLLQHLVPNEVRGRVMSLLQLNLGLSQILALPIAALGQWLTLERLFPTLALLVLTAVAAIVTTRPELRRATIANG